MNAAPTDFPAPRVTPRLGSAFGGIWRLTLQRFLSPVHGATVVGMIAVLILLATASNHEAAHDPVEAHSYFKWFVEFYLCLLLPIMTFITAGGAIRDELKPDSVDYVLTRPVPRPVFIVARFLSHIVFAQVGYLLAFAALVGVGMYRHVPDLFPPLPLLLLAQVLLVIVFSALGFFLGLLNARYVVSGLCYGGFVEIGIGQIPTQLNRLSMIHQVLAMFPSMIFRLDAVLPPAASALSVATILLSMTLFLIVASVVVFSLKELSGAQGKET